MTHKSEIAHSAYMIGKARARLLYRRSEQRLIAGTADTRRIALEAEITALMEARLTALLRMHSSLIAKAASGSSASNIE